MSWEKAQRTIRLKPYLIDPCRLRGIAAARKRLVYEGMPLPEKVLATARLRAEMSIPQWETYLGMSDKKIRRKCRKAVPVRFGTLLYISRRAVIAWAIIILIASFMTFTPVGRAWAVAVYNAVSEVIDNILYVRSDESSSIPESVDAFSHSDDEVIKIESLDAALEQIEKPVYCLSEDAMQPESISLSKSTVYGDSLETIYRMPNKGVIIISQCWDDKSEDSIILDESKEYVRLDLPNGIVVEGAFSKDDNAFVGTIVTSDTVVHIFIQEIATEESISESLSTLTAK